MLVVLFGPQQALGAWLKEQFDFSIIFAPPGIILALLFITFPFVVRVVQPVLIDLDKAQEDAATTLGAKGWTIFRRITLPPLVLPLAVGRCSALRGRSASLGRLSSWRAISRSTRKRRRCMCWARWSRRTAWAPARCRL